MRSHYLVFFLTLFFISQAQADPLSVQQQLEGFNLSGYTDTGAKSWDINGDTADISDKTIAIKNVNANAYGEVPANLTADNGTIDKASGNIHLEENVVITAQEQGTQLRTDSLDWQRNEGLITTEDRVVIQDEGMRVAGTGMRAQPDLKIAALNEDVVANVEPSSKTKLEQSIEVTCDGPMEIDQLKEMAVFNKNVVAIEKESGRELRADKMEIYFDSKQSKLKKLICMGNVAVTQAGNTSYSDQLIYDAQTQKMTLSGKPKLVLDMKNKEFKSPLSDLGK